MIYSVHEGLLDDFHAKEFSRTIKSYIEWIEEESLTKLETTFDKSRKTEDKEYTVTIPDKVIKKFKDGKDIPDEQIVMNDLKGSGFRYSDTSKDGSIIMVMDAKYSNNIFIAIITKCDKGYNVHFKNHESIIESTILI